MTLNDQQEASPTSFEPVDVNTSWNLSSINYSHNVPITHQDLSNSSDVCIEIDLTSAPLNLNFDPEVMQYIILFLPYKSINL